MMQFNVMFCMLAKDVRMFVYLFICCTCDVKINSRTGKVIAAKIEKSYVLCFKSFVLSDSENIASLYFTRILFICKD